MCGRYASSRRPEDLLEEFEVVDDRVPAPLEPDCNVAPTKDVYAVVERPPRSDDAERDQEPSAQRQLRVLRWGLVPSWAKDAVDRQPDDQRPARRPWPRSRPSARRFAARRCLLPADGYYEWYPTSQLTKAGKPRKQPFFIRPRDGGVLAMAGLYEIWRDPDRAEDDPDRFRWTCTVITTAADGRPRPHPRPDAADGRPGAVRRVAGPGDGPAATLLDLLEPAAPGRLEAYPVSTLVSNVRNNGPELVEPLPLEEGWSE